MKCMPCANQTHRALGHNFGFLKFDRGLGNLGMNSLEGLESSNSSTKTLMITILSVEIEKQQTVESLNF